MSKKAPFYVMDTGRNLIVGRFMKLESAQDVQALLQAHAIDPKNVTIRDSDWQWLIDARLKDQYDRYVKADEAMLQAIAAEKYLPSPKHDMRGMVVMGGVYQSTSGEQIIATRLESSGPKYQTWYMVGAVSGGGYTVKKLQRQAFRPLVRMATVKEWARALGRAEYVEQKAQERIDTNTAHISLNDIGIGDTVTVRYSDIGDRNEVVEAINHKNGRVAIKRTGFAAARYEKRRFIDAKHIVAVVEKCADPYRRNPINDPMWMR